jgi:hypothetical protein
VNSLLSTPSPLADQKEGQEEHMMMITIANGSMLHGTVLHDTVPELVKLVVKFHAGNSPLNFNQELHTEDHVTTIDHTMIISRAELKSQEGDIE